MLALSHIGNSTHAVRDKLIMEASACGGGEKTARERMTVASKVFAVRSRRSFERRRHAASRSRLIVFSACVLAAGMREGERKKERA